MPNHKYLMAKLTALAALAALAYVVEHKTDASVVDVADLLVELVNNFTLNSCATAIAVVALFPVVKFFDLGVPLGLIMHLVIVSMLTPYVRDWSQASRPLSGALPDILNQSVGLQVNLDAVWHQCSQSKPVLQEVVGSFESGSITWVMGQAGAGKSTCLKVLSGRMGPQACFQGDIKVNGKSLYRNDPEVPYRNDSSSKEKISYATIAAGMRKHQVDKLIAFMPQNDDSFVHKSLTVANNLHYSLMWRRPDQSWHARHKSVEYILKDLDIEHQRDNLMASPPLNGGDLERANLAVSMIGAQPVLLADEPTSGQEDDLATTEALHAWARQGRTVISVVHKISDESFLLGDSVLLLSGRSKYKDLPTGRVIYWGSTSGVLEHFALYGIHRKNEAEDIYKLLSRTSKCEGFPKDACLALQMNKSHVKRTNHTVKNQDVTYRDTEVIFALQVLVAFRRTISIALADAKYCVGMIVILIFMCLKVREASTSDAQKLATGSYIFNLFTFIAMSIFPTKWMVEETLPFLGRESPEGFGEYSFLVGKMTAMFLVTQVLALIHVTWMWFLWQFKLCQHPAPNTEFKYYIQSFQLAYVYLCMVSFVVGWFLTSQFSAHAIVILCHLVFAVFLAGFYPEFAELATASPLMRRLVLISPPFFILRKLLAMELGSQNNAFFLPVDMRIEGKDYSSRCADAKQKFHEKFRITGNTWGDLYMDDTAKTAFLVLVFYQTITVSLFLSDVGLLSQLRLEL